MSLYCWKAPGHAFRQPSKWLSQITFSDSKHMTHGYIALIFAAQDGDMLAVHGPWSERYAEAEQLLISGFTDALRGSEVRPVHDRGCRPAREDMRVLYIAGNHCTSQPGDREITVASPECERAVAPLRSWHSMQHTRPSWRTHHLVTAAVAVLVGF